MRDKLRYTAGVMDYSELAMKVSRVPRARSVLLILLVVCMGLTGCQYVPFLRDRQPDQPPASQTSSESSAEAAARSSSVQRAMTLLQDGREREAEAMLEGIIETDSDNPTALLLMAQIRQPPEELLGEDFESITVKPGDSLSEIAGRTMNNELLFYALARLNDVEVPRLLQSGQRLRIPRLDMPETLTDEATVAPDSQPSQESVREREDSEPQLVDTARRLLEESRNAQANALLLSAARAGKLEHEYTSLLAASAAARAGELCAGDDPAQAIKVLNQAAPWIGAAADSGDFAAQRRHVQARQLLDEAEQRLMRGNYDLAFESLAQARERSGDLDGTHGERLDRLVEALSVRFHDQALSAWRDQRVDESLRLWERVVRIDPSFVPAQRYLERARAAKRKLEALEALEDD